MCVLVSGKAVPFPKSSGDVADRRAEVPSPEPVSPTLVEALREVTRRNHAAIAAAFQRAQGWSRRMRTT